jgi:DNA-binding LacI/PurR family transcriptional regulator
MECDFVGLDNYGAFRDAGQRLAQSGFRSVVLVGKSNSMSALKRICGFSDGFGERGIRQIQTDDDSGVTGALADAVTSTHSECIVIADASVSVALSEAILERSGTPPCIVGVAEWGERIPGPRSWTLEKPGIELGRRAVEILREPHAKTSDGPKVLYLPLRPVPETPLP